MEYPAGSNYACLVPGRGLYTIPSQQCFGSIAFVSRDFEIWFIAAALPAFFAIGADSIIFFYSIYIFYPFFSFLTP